MSNSVDRPEIVQLPTESPITAPASAAPRMQTNKTRLLIVLVIFLSVVTAIVGDLRIAGYLSLHTQLVAAFLAFGFNLLVAIAGLWTRHRVAWISYLVVSVACMSLLGTSTPFGAAWILIKLATRHILT